MDIATAGTLTSKIFPVVLEIISFIMKHKGSLEKKPDFRKQVKEMVTVIQSDISDIRGEIYHIRDEIADMGVDTGKTNTIPWQVPPDINGVKAWIYRRRTRRIISFADEFRNSVNGIIDVISCCSSFMEGTAAIQKSDEQTGDQAWAHELAHSYDEVMRKVVSPEKYSIDDLTNEMERFLDQSTLALQKVARSV
jgi:hypothetical protein